MKFNSVNERAKSICFWPAWKIVVVCFMKRMDDENETLSFNEFRELIWARVKILWCYQEMKSFYMCINSFLYFFFIHVKVSFCLGKARCRGTRTSEGEANFSTLLSIKISVIFCLSPTVDQFWGEMYLEPSYRISFLCSYFFCYFVRYNWSFPSLFMSTQKGYLNSYK